MFHQDIFNGGVSKLIPTSVYSWLGVDLVLLQGFTGTRWCVHRQFIFTQDLFLDHPTYAANFTTS